MATEQALSALHEAIRNDSFLNSASLEPLIVIKTLEAFEGKVPKALTALKNYAIWHKETLGHQSKRISIVHIHAFLLAGVFCFLPNVTGHDGRPITLYRAYKDRAGSIPKQHYANFCMWMSSYYLQEFGSINDSFFLNLDGFKFSCFRPSNYKVMADAQNGFPIKLTNATLVAFHASKTTKRVWDAIYKQLKDIEYTVHFIDKDQVSKFVDPAKVPVDFGGLVSLADSDANMEEFIRDQYAREGIRYEPIDVSEINWKTYKIPDVDLSVRPESAMSVSSNIDFDKIDAQVEAMGLGNEEHDA
ncbi:UNVERIFIED_CONTAM: hypothetical protein HDU68_007849 [Siphonaria sp. JEL0065]|nr:hypothetical protein HDU68_007849 [Siphonaria sp. JEL0065]